MTYSCEKSQCIAKACFRNVSLHVINTDLPLADCNVLLITACTVETVFSKAD